jgi:hypothetical protein
VGNFDLPKALASLVPVLLAAMWWVISSNLWLVTSLEVLQDTQRNLMWSKHVRVAKKKLFGLERKALVQLVNPKLGNLHV